MRAKSRVIRKAFGVKAHGRSRITNGSALLPSVDGRGIYARRLRDLINLHESDLGGADALSTAERSIIRRSAALTVELEHLELKFVQQGEATADQLLLYQRVASTLRRLLEAVGLQRRPKDITPTLSEYLRQKAAQADDAEVINAEAAQ